MPACSSVSYLLPAPTSSTDETALVCGMLEVTTRMPLGRTVRWWSPAMTGSEALRMLLDGTGGVYAEAMAAVGDRQRRLPFYRKGD